MTRRITLSFDNGPDATTTPAVLDLLGRHGVLSTFFVLGSKVATEEGADLARRARGQGHWLGNHTYSHRVPLGLLTASEALQEVTGTARLIESIGEPLRLFRPYGGGGRIGKHLLRLELVDWLTANEYTCVLWNCVPGDWRDPEGWITRALAEVETRDWSLVVLHDIHSAPLKHLDYFLNELEARGYEVVQQFPPDCMPIVDGRIVKSLEGLTA